MLVSRSADKSCKDKQGYTPLHAAAASGHLEIVKYLLRMGAEVNVGFSWRFTRQNTQSRFESVLTLAYSHLRLMSPMVLETLHSTWPATWARRRWPRSW